MINKQAITKFIRDYGNITALAREAGIDRTYIHMFLNGTRQPGMKFVEGMMKAGMDSKDVFLN